MHRTAFAMSAVWEFREFRVLQGHLEFQAPTATRGAMAKPDLWDREDLWDRKARKATRDPQGLRESPAKDKRTDGNSAFGKALIVELTTAKYT